MAFDQLHLSKAILRAVAEAGYTTPSPIQKKAIPPVLAGRDLLGCAQTGTGKTAAFALPILQQLITRKQEREGKKRAIRALILTPTRELALQIQENFEAYSKYLPLKSTVIFGGVGQAPQVATLKKGVDILVATPGRLIDLIGQGLISLADVEIFVLDEADRMLDMGFVNDVKRVIRQLPEKRQTLLFSATMPDEIVKLANSLLHNPAKIYVTPASTTVESINQSLYKLEKADKRKLLAQLLRGPDVGSALVFTRTKHGADRVAKILAREGITAAAIHGDKSQGARQSALARFKKGEVKALVATDIAARGIDIHELSHVVNFDLPNIPETYVHRIGRTGRAGRGGIAISFCSPDEQEYLADIEKLIGFAIPEEKNHPWFAPGQPAEKPADKPLKKEAEKQGKFSQKNQKKQAKKEPENTQNTKKAAPEQPKKQPQKGGQRRGRRGPLPPYDPYENLKGGSAIVTRTPIWARPETTPEAQPESEDSMSRNRRRGGKNRKKTGEKAGLPTTGKVAKDKLPVIPKDEKGLFSFTEEELAEDTAIQVVSRRENDEQKFASFEDYLKARENGDA